METRDKILTNPHVAYFLTAAAAIFYSYQAWVFSRAQRSLLDEGNYLLKGYLFVTNQYTPFQDFGPWTNQMPLAFLIPGYVQKIFGPGLLTGRIHALILSLVILILAVMIGIRLGGIWGGALTAVVLAFSPAQLKVYTQVMTEGLTAVMLLISLLCILGKDCPTWQLLIGSLVAGLIPVTRLNLAPVVPLIALYIGLEYGWKKGLLAMAVSLLPAIGFHIFYWPGIFFQLWAKWIPGGLIPAVDLWEQGLGNAIQSHQTNYSFSDRLLAFSQGIRFQLPAVLSVLISLGFWPADWSDRSRKRSAILVLMLFIILFLLHFWAAIFLDYNIHAFFRYLCSFSFLGIFLVLLTWDEWNLKMDPWRQIAAGASLLVLALVVGYSISEQSSVFGVWFKEVFIIRFNHLFGETHSRIWSWWDSFQTRLGWDYAFTFQVLILGLSATLIAVIGAAVRWFNLWQEKNNRPLQGISVLAQVMLLIYLLGLMVSPTRVFGRGYGLYDCQNALGQYDVAIKQADPFINQGDQVFYIGKDTQVVLLGLAERKGINLYPQQLNAYNSFYLGGIASEATRRGFWNDEIAQSWIDNSQVLLFEQQAIAGYFKETAAALDLSQFELVGETNNTCTYDQRIYIYRKP